MSKKCDNHLQQLTDHTHQIQSPIAGYTRTQLIGFITLLSGLLAVIFILPNQVDPLITIPSTPPEQTEQTEQPIQKQPLPDSPWSDAQLAKQRRQAQETLSKILAIQEQLEDKQINQWAATAYAEAIATTASGDQLYRERQFTPAQQRYQTGLQQFTQLLQQVDQVFVQQMRQGATAIEKQQPELAVKAYRLATLLKPADLEARNGLERAKQQKSVIHLLQQAQQQHQAEQFPQARQSLQQALTLDPLSSAAQTELALIEQAITNQAFATAMSQGYAAINQQAYQTAIDAFQQALTIKPDANDAQIAHQQATNQHLQQQVVQHLNTAQQLEGQELWQQAEQHYAQVFSLDASVIQAKVGMIRTQARADLNQKLQTSIQQAPRLADNHIRQQTQALLNDARRIPQPGPLLTKQIGQLTQLITDFDTPIAVEFKSNNQTAVTLYRIAKLGNFTAKRLQLKPGKYVLVGTRQGYRDVRREFIIEPGVTPPIITVQCEEKISNG